MKIIGNGWAEKKFKERKRNQAIDIFSDIQL
jgi:hypothetical protein